MKEQKISKLRTAAGIFLCLVCLSLGQVIQASVQKLMEHVLPQYGFASVVSAVVYIAAVYVMLTMICRIVLLNSLEECRIGRIHIKWKWLVAAILLPLLVSGIMFCFPGKLIANNLSKQEMFRIMIQQIFVYGISGGIVEEMIFRGVMMSSIERVNGRRWAVIIPSIIFALGHVANGKDFMGGIMILIAGICVAVMFSFVTYDSNTIWCSTIIHIIWNSSVLGGLLNISTVQTNDSIYSYVIENTNSLTNSLQNVESSLIAIAAYCLVAAAAYYSLRKKDFFHIVE